MFECMVNIATVNIATVNIAMVNIATVNITTVNIIIPGWGSVPGWSTHDPS